MNENDNPLAIPPGQSPQDLPASKDASRPLATAVQIALHKSADGGGPDSGDHVALAPAAGGPAGDGTIQAGYAAIPKPEPEPGPCFVDLTKTSGSLPKVTIIPADGKTFTNRTILSGRGLFYEGERILQPNHHINLRKFLQEEGDELVTADEIKRLLNLQENHTRLMDQITAHTNTAVRARVQDARKKLTEEPTQENISAHKLENHSKEYLESQYRDVRIALKHALHNLYNDEIHPIVGPILLRAADQLVPIIELQKEKEIGLHERLGLPFIQSPALVALKYACARLCQDATSPPESVFPPSPRAMLRPIFDLSAPGL